MKKAKTTPRLSRRTARTLRSIMRWTQQMRTKNTKERGPHAEWRTFAEIWLATYTLLYNVDEL